MCGRYRLDKHWERDLHGHLCVIRDHVDIEYDPVVLDGSEEVFPRERMPIIRRNEVGKMIAELRQWGFIMQVNGKSLDAEGMPKRVRRDVFNAMSEKLTSSFMWKWSFKERRCLIPMSSWDEWPEAGGVKQRVRVSMPSEPVFMAAGLYDVNTDPKTGDKVPVYTMCTVPPNEFLGTVHDRAPMVLLPEQYESWLAGGSEALSLVGVHPDASAFRIEAVPTSSGKTAWPSLLDSA